MYNLLGQIPTDAGADLTDAVTDGITQGWPVFLAMSAFVIGLAVFRKVRRG